MLTDFIFLWVLTTLHAPTIIWVLFWIVFVVDLIVFLFGNLKN